MSLNNLKKEGRTDLLNNLDLQWFAEDAGEDGGSEDGGDGAGGSDGGDEPAGWLAGVAEEYRGHDFVKDRKNPTEMVKAALDLNEKLKTAAFKPGENATDEDLAAWNEFLGVPADAKGYELDTSGVPEQMVNEELVSWYRDQAHKLGLPKDAAESLFKAWNEKTVSSIGALQQKQKFTEEKGQEKMKEEWGEEYESNMARANLAVKTFGGEDLVNFLDETGLTNDPRMIKAMHKFASLVSEDVFQGEGGSEGGETSRRKPGELNLSNSFPDK